MRTPTTHGTDDHDLARMERWTAWVVRLTSRAVSRANDPSLRAWIEGAREDAESMREALGAAARGWLDAGQVATVRSVYELWDANHDRIERLVAEVDPIGHQVWRVRSAGARPGHDPMALEPQLSAVG
jgi:hypothetical protein